MRTAYWLVVLVIAIGGTVLVTQHVGTADAAPAPVAQPAVEALPVGTVKDVMKGIVDPNAMAVWDAVSAESTPTGVVEKAPKTDAEWAVVEHNALTLAEAANLLKDDDPLVEPHLRWSCTGRTSAQPHENTMSVSRFRRGRWC